MSKAKVTCKTAGKCAVTLQGEMTLINGQTVKVFSTDIQPVITQSMRKLASRVGTPEFHAMSAYRQGQALKIHSMINGK
jgi:hypothetical protein